MHRSTLRRIGAHATLAMVVTAGTLTTAIPFARGAGSSEATPVRATLEVDVIASGRTDLVVARRIEERGNLVLRRAAIIPGQGADDATIRVSVRELPPDTPGYRVTLGTYRSGAALEGSEKSFECNLCTEGELVERVEAAIADFVPALRNANATSASRGPYQAVPSGSPESEPKTREPARDIIAPERARWTALGKAGIGVLVAGSVGVAVGIGLAVPPPRPKTEMPLEETTTRPPGYALLAVGGTAIVTGIVLVVVDRRRDRQAKTTVIPTVGPQTAGVGLVARF